MNWRARQRAALEAAGELLKAHTPPIQPTAPVLFAAAPVTPCWADQIHDRQLGSMHFVDEQTREVLLAMGRGFAVKAGEVYEDIVSVKRVEAVDPTVERRPLPRFMVVPTRNEIPTV